MSRALLARALGLDPLTSSETYFLIGIMGTVTPITQPGGIAPTLRHCGMKFRTEAKSEWETGPMGSPK